MTRATCDPEAPLVQVAFDGEEALALSSDRLFLLVPGSDVCWASESVSSELMAIAPGHRLYTVEKQDTQLQLNMYKWAAGENVLKLGLPERGPLLCHHDVEAVTALAVSSDGQYLAVGLTFHVILFKALQVVLAGLEGTRAGPFVHLEACFTRSAGRQASIDQLHVSCDGVVAAACDDCSVHFWCPFPPILQKPKARDTPVHSRASPALEAHLQDFHVCTMGAMRVFEDQQHALSVGSAELLVWDMHTGLVAQRRRLPVDAHVAVPRDPRAWARQFACVRAGTVEYGVLALAMPDDCNKCDSWLLLDLSSLEVVSQTNSSQPVTALTVAVQGEDPVVLVSKELGDLQLFDRQGALLGSCPLTHEARGIHCTALNRPLLVASDGGLHVVVLGGRLQPHLAGGVGGSPSDDKPVPDGDHG
jgi:hypothetical protein